MKKVFAALLIPFFTLAIITAPRGGQLNPPKDLGGTVVQLSGAHFQISRAIPVSGHIQIIEAFPA